MANIVTLFPEQKNQQQKPINKNAPTSYSHYKGSVSSQSSDDVTLPTCTSSFASVCSTNSTVDNPSMNSGTLLQEETNKHYNQPSNKTQQVVDNGSLSHQVPDEIDVKNFVDKVLADLAAFDPNWLD